MGEICCNANLLVAIEVIAEVIKIHNSITIFSL
jgi:hypothetical protein